VTTTSTPNVLATPDDKNRIGPQADVVIQPLRRQTVTFDWQNPIKGSYVWVKVWGGSRKLDQTDPGPEIAWRMYPPEPRSAPLHEAGV
jgi:hypothetical protein